MDSIDRSIIERKARAWASLAERLAAMVADSRAEAERLLGPARGE